MLAQAGGFILVTPNQHQNPNANTRAALFPLEARSLNVQANIHGQIATTTIKQVFFNPSNQQLEGHFLFPVPKGVVITDFEMLINGKPHKAELLDATKARNIYEAIVRRAQDPALLEYYHQQLFRVRIFPILPQKEQIITLTYTETLTKNNQTTQYRFPLNPTKHASKPIEKVSISVNLHTQSPLKTFYCPSHDTEITRKSNQHAILGYEGTGASANRDFQCYFSTDAQVIGLSMLAYRQKKEQGYFFINLSPGVDEKAAVLPKDVVFVVDKSASMTKQKMDQAKKALHFCVEHLNPQDRFEVIAFSTVSDALFGSVQTNQPKRLKDALQFIDDLDPIGGTNIEEALSLALSSQKTERERPFFIIFLTDGKPTIGETDQDKLLKSILAQNTEHVRIFTFGIGTNLNTHLLDRLTQETKAYRTYVLPEEDIEVKVSDFYTKAASPVLTNLKLKFESSMRVSEVYDRDLPDLFRGESISVLGRYRGTGPGTLTLTGDMNGVPKTYSYKINLPEESTDLAFIPNLWGARAVGDLLDQIRLHGKSEELVQNVTQLAKRYGIITPYTSYLIIEDEEVAVQQRRLPVERQVLRPRTQQGPGFSSAPVEALNSDVAEEVELMEKERSTSGNATVQASKQAEAYNRATNLGAVANDKKRLEVRDAAGQTHNLGDNIVQVQGRAVYQNNGNWMDAALTTTANAQLKVNNVKFGSPEYFKLAQDARAAEFLALGNNVSFILDGVGYAVAD